MPHPVRPKAKTPTKPKRPAHRPTKFTPELGEEIGALIACGWLMKDAARLCGIPPETVCRWVVRHEGFREVYAVARAQRTEFWGGEIIGLADDATRDYATDKHGNRVFNYESVHRARLRIEARKWIMVRLDPRLWGERQQIDLKSDWSLLTQEERQRKARELIAMVEDMKKPPMEAPAIVYRPEEPSEDGDQQQRGNGWQPRPVTGRREHSARSLIGVGAGSEREGS
jgi:hypothetical protein